MLSEMQENRFRATQENAQQMREVMREQTDGSINSPKESFGIAFGVFLRIFDACLLQFGYIFA